MSGIKTIERNPIKRTTNSVQPAQVAHPSTLGDNLPKGTHLLQESIKLLSQNKIYKIVNNATVLENVSPDKSASKVKYKILHLNSKEEGAELEDYLLKIRSPYDEGVIENPEDILRDVYDSCNNLKSLFTKESESKEDIELSKKRYFKAVSMHGTFAPLYSSGILSSPPLPGSKVRLHYFQSPMISSGEPIAGFYEKMYDDSVFEEACSEIAKLLSVFRSAFEKAAKIVSTSKSNIPKVAAATPDGAAPAESVVAGGVLAPVPPSIIAGNIKICPAAHGSITDASFPHISVEAPLVGDPNSPNRNLYDAVIDQFDVVNNPRYKARPYLGRASFKTNPNKVDTYCNLFVADVSWAMGMPVPWSVIDRAGSKNDSPFGPEWKYISGHPSLMEDPKNMGIIGAEEMIKWIAGSYGRMYGWENVSPKEAQDCADKGYLTIVGGINTGHISIIRPSLIDPKTGKVETYQDGRGPACASSGATSPFANKYHVINSFGSAKTLIVKYFTNRTTLRQVQITDNQQKRLDQFKSSASGKPVA